MTNSEVDALLAMMEAWLADPAWELEAESLADWTSRFNDALATADRSHGWIETAERSHRVGRQLEQRLQSVIEAKERIRVELEQQDKGVRALKGYGTVSR